MTLYGLDKDLFVDYEKTDERNDGK
jgi:hypothetical protein